jgi:hypothetical protein
MRQWDAGILSNTAGLESIMGVISRSQYSGVDFTGSLGSQWMESDALVKIREIEYSHVGRRYRIDLTTSYDTVDLGLSLYGPEDQFYGKADVVDDPVTGPALSYRAPPDGTESIHFTVQQPGWYAITVWKVGSADRADSTIFQLRVTEVQAVGSDEPIAPLRTRLVRVYPNPFNPRTNIIFELEKSEDVRIEVFDVRGRLVRVLVDEALPQGRHERAWGGLDDKGQGVASGMYLIRLRSGSTVDHERISLIK